MKVKTSEPEGFADFWQIWQPRMRHTDGRGDARNCYRKHVLMGADPQDIIDGARGFFAFMPEKDKPYVPLAASWLNKEAYPDWAVKWREFQARLAETAAKRTAPPPKPIIQPEQAKEDREAIARRVYERLGMTALGEVH
ncbi:MAG: hypothetical protein WC100_18915 [Sterolibacterium sp.]